jgi:hypothetical protein
MPKSSKLALAVLATALWSTHPANAQTNSERIETFANELPRNDWGGAMYWVEMESAIGWEKMMLVVGYASNGPVCERLAAIARIDSPDREFRCSTAN